MYQNKCQWVQVYMPEVEQEHLKELFHADTHCFLFIFNPLDLIVRLEFGPS